MHSVTTMEAKAQQELRELSINDSGELLSQLHLQEVEEILGYKFKDQNLLVEAFTHHSYQEGCLSYERFEYLGDSVLNLLITKEQFFLYPDLSPGVLTRLRAANVGKEKLARVAIKHGLHPYIQHKTPSLEHKIQEFIQGMKDYPLHSNGLLNAPKVLSDIIESIIGAIFIDCNCSLDIVWKVFKKLLEPIIIPETLGVHPVTQLLELCQKNGWRMRFETSGWKENTTIDVFVEDHLVGRATYAPKKEVAVNRAANDALKNVQGTLQVKNEY